MTTAEKGAKQFPGEVSQSFQDILLQVERKGPLTRPLARVAIFLLQPLLGALPHRIKKDLEKAVGQPAFFNTAGASGLNILLNMTIYPVILMAAAAALRGVEVLFSAEINLYILVGVMLGLLEGVYRLREGLFYVKPAGEIAFGAAFYGIPLAYALQPLLAGGPLRSGGAGRPGWASGPVKSKAQTREVAGFLAGGVGASDT